MIMTLFFVIINMPYEPRVNDHNNTDSNNNYNYGK